jgi:hypothetical protein
MAKQDEYIRITARLPPELHDALVRLSKKTERSLNGELVARLQIAIDQAMEELHPDIVRQTVAQYEISDPLQELIELIKSLPAEKQRALLSLLK